MLTNEYLKRVYDGLAKRNANEPEFLQAVREVLESIQPVVEKHPEYEKAGLIERLVEPERIISFRVPWVDDQGKVQVNRGYRVQFNSAIGPYKGGLRFHPDVTPSVVKFLGFEQTYKNALTGLPIGGAAGGADFTPRGKSQREIMRFCQAFMTALYRYIGADTDVPAGDIGVGSREIGYLYGQYKRLMGKVESSALTGKGLTYGGSKIREEAAGFGTVYFLARMLEHQSDSLQGKTIAVSGFGNMAWGICHKASELGARVVTLSGPDGYVYDPDGVTTQEKLNFLLAMRAGGQDRVSAYADRFGAQFFPGRRPWEVPVDIVIPCATQNELDVEDAVRFEVADMRNFRREDTYGQLVTNPPYGERLLERQEAEALYRDFGKMWERLPDTWRTLVLSSHTEFERTFGHQAKKKRKLYNGMIKCDLFMYGNV